VCGRAVDCQKTFPRSARIAQRLRRQRAARAKQATHARNYNARSITSCSGHFADSRTATGNCSSPLRATRRIQKICFKPTPRELSFLFVFLDARGLVVGVRSDDDCALHDGCHGQELLRQETARERAAGRLQVFCIKRITSEASSARCSKCSKTGDEWVWKPVIALGFPTYKTSE
jgi:hypothetical protein